MPLAVTLYLNTMPRTSAVLRDCHAPSEHRQDAGNHAAGTVAIVTSVSLWLLLMSLKRQRLPL